MHAAMLQVDRRELTESITSRNHPNLLSQTSDSSIVSTFLNHTVSRRRSVGSQSQLQHGVRQLVRLRVHYPRHRMKVPGCNGEILRPVASLTAEP